MSKVLDTPFAFDAKRTLEDILADTNKVRAVIIIRLMDDGTQRLDCSHATFEEKCFLKCFFDSWIMKWFDQSYNV